MFSGIVQNKGILVKKVRRSGQIRFAIKIKKPEKKLQLGESIAVNGVCLTVVKKAKNLFEADVMSETLKATSLGNLLLREQVNIERSLKYGDRIGGHFVLGHVDGVGVIKKINQDGMNQIWTIQAPRFLLRQIAKKGSIAIDGISLTIQKIRKNGFDIALIPFTLSETNLHKKNVGAQVNLEIDMITRYAQVSRLFGKAKGKAISVKELKKNGF